MKRISIAVLLLVSTVLVKAQTNPFPRTIQVNGSAEMELIPDEIYVHIQLKEYEKKGQGKIALQKITENFLRQYKSIGMHDTLISIASYDGFQNDWIVRKRKKKDELFASVTYQVKFENSRQMDQLVERLDDEATQSFRVVRTSHSKLPELRKQLKMEAVKAAKEKAGYLSLAAGEKLGQAITINEPTEYFQPYSRVSNKMMDAVASVESEETLPDVDFMKIRLKYDVHAVFALQ